jgi:hypothetical protein
MLLVQLDIVVTNYCQIIIQLICLVCTLYVSTYLSISISICLHTVHLGRLLEIPRSNWSCIGRESSSDFWITLCSYDIYRIAIFLVWPEQKTYIVVGGNHKGGAVEARHLLFNSIKSCKYHQTIHFNSVAVVLKDDNLLFNDWKDDDTGAQISLLRLLIMMNS